MSIHTVEQIVQNLQSYKDQSNTLMILGSGWNEVVEDMEVEKRFGFDQVFGNGAGVAGHRGELILGRLEGKPVWVMAGRFHTYEGYTTEEVTRPIQAFTQLGIEEVILTSAAGGLNETYDIGDMIIISDMITLFCESPVRGAHFVDLSQPFDIGLRQKAIDVCKSQGIAYREGVTVTVRGPHYESFADKRALKVLGADCVGMSTVPETIMANSLGLKVLGLSCVTNLAFVKHDHHEVVSNAKAQSEKMKLLLSSILR